MKKIVPLERYIKRTREGVITRFWSEDNQPEQIAKVAESQGLRATWPDEFQGLYTDAERESMDAQAGFDRDVKNGAAAEQRREDLETKLGKGKPAVEPHKEQPLQNIKTDTKDPKPPPGEPPPEKKAVDPIRDGDIYKDFDPFGEGISQRYHEAKVLKIKDALDQAGIDYAKSWPGAKLHKLLIDSQEPELELGTEQGQEPDPDPEPPEVDDPQTLLALQSDIARTKSGEPELYRHAYINQLQLQTVRPDVLTSEMTIAECEALLTDVDGQKKLRDQM